jgi:hypothetical protein
MAICTLVTLQIAGNTRNSFFKISTFDVIIPFSEIILFVWTCPVCNHKFYNKNQAHSCVTVTVDDFLKGKNEEMIRLFKLFLAKYEEIGAFEVHPVKTRIALLKLMRFASVNRIAKDHIDIHLVLTSRFEDPLFYKIDNLDNRFFVHHFRLFKAADITPELELYMRKAYEVGERKHIRNSGEADW